MREREREGVSMSPPKNLLPLFLLALVVLSLFSFQSPDLGIAFLRSPIVDQKGVVLQKYSSRSAQNFRFIVKVLAYDRIDSLARCLRSLADADYDGDRVDLHVFLDHFRASDAGNDSSTLDRNLEAARQMLEFVDGFGWRVGDKIVHYRTRNVGLQAQWLEAWWPGSDDEFAFVVEDDLQLSPVYYRYLKKLIATYYYDPSNFNPSIYGASLQRPRFVAGKHGNKLRLDDETHVFLYQMVGTWGQLLFPKPWKEFRLWYDLHKVKNIQPILSGMVTTGWYMRMGERIWTPWFIKFIHARGYYNIYTNLLHERALSISHREPGVNYGRKVGPDSTLINSSDMGIDLWDMRPMKSMKWFDFCFKEVLPGRVVKSLNDLVFAIHSVQRNKSVVLLNLYQVPAAVSSNLLCQLGNVNIQNYIILGNDNKFLNDLARRGHVVIDGGKLVQDAGKMFLTGFQSSKSKKIKEFLVTAYVLRKTIEIGYSAWLINGDVLPVSNIFSNFTNDMHDFAVANSLDLSFFKGSSSIVKTLDDKFIDKLLIELGSLTGGELPSKKQGFGHLAAKYWKENGLTVQVIDASNISYQITHNDENQTNLGDGRNLVSWSPDINLDVVKGRLKGLGLWTIDEELSCTSVICHSEP